MHAYIPQLTAIGVLPTDLDDLNLTSIVDSDSPRINQSNDKVISVLADPGLPNGMSVSICMCVRVCICKFYVCVCVYVCVCGRFKAHLFWRIMACQMA
jgi:hypothetical protein